MNQAACLFYTGMFEEATQEAGKGPACTLQNRIRFHCSHRMNDESALMTYHQKLTDSTEDQLSLASIHFLRSHFQEVCQPTANMNASGE
jgi:intraflagellar transport protein 56